MVDRSGTPKGERLPIKLILPKQGKEKRVPGGGTPPKPFRPVNAAYRMSLSKQVSAIRDAVLPQVKQTGAAPVRVKLLTSTRGQGAPALTLWPSVNTAPLPEYWTDFTSPMFLIVASRTAFASLAVP